MKNIEFFKANKNGFIYGFIFAAIIAPMLASLGLISRFFEKIRPLLIGPFDFVAKLIPSVQTGPRSYETPFYK